jgi:hypothetical protein
MIVAFDKEASGDPIDHRTDDCHKNVDAWRSAPPDLEYWSALQAWASATIMPAVRGLPGGVEKPWPGLNFPTPAYLRLWLCGPVPRAAEIDKVIGFPVLSSRDRAAYRRLGFNLDIQNPVLRACITMATLQPVSTFQNALSSRISTVQRAGGGSRRKGSSYIDGSACNPRVLIAALNIWRIHDTFFDWRPWSSPEDEEATVKETHGEMRARSSP